MYRESIVEQANLFAAEKTGFAILQKTAQLALHPRMGRIVPERKDPAIRELMHPPFRIVYRVIEPAGREEILRLWHGARGTPVLL